MLNADAPEFFVSSTSLLPTYYCFSPSDWYYHYAHWYQSPPCPYILCVPNGSSLQYVEGMGGEARTKSGRNRSRSRTGRNGKVVASRWRPKSKSSQVINVKVPTLFEFKEEVAEVVGKTTVMIKNIPNKYRNMLIDLLDKHCAEVNTKIASLGEKEKQPPSTYDFVYLPMDFKSRCNLGYAFVNLTTPIATSRLFRFLHKSKWQDFCSKKICQITYARIQGKRALKAHFSQSSFACDSDEYLPVEFIPPRDGFYASIGVTSGQRLSSRP